jgi:hypothetical protein
MLTAGVALGPSNVPELETAFRIGEATRYFCVLHQDGRPISTIAPHA